jgi:hypothetical protein
MNKKLVRPYLRNKLNMVALACGPSYLGCGGRRITVPGYPRQKHETLNNKLKTKGLAHGSSGKALV